MRKIKNEERIVMLSELLGGPIPLFEYQREVYCPSGMKSVERSWSVVWFRRRLTVRLES